LIRANRLNDFDKARLNSKDTADRAPGDRLADNKPI
jgi:hypothetical protein